MPSDSRTENIGELADSQLGSLTVLEELVDDLKRGHEIRQYQIEDAEEAVEDAQDGAAEILRRYEDREGPI